MIIKRIKKASLHCLSDGKIFYSLLLVALLIQITSLNLFMEPWFDEVVFADISHSLATQQGFFLNIHPLSAKSSEVFMFGPVFFYVEAFIIKKVGLTSFSFRSVPYIFGVLTSVICSKIVYRITKRKTYERAFLALFFSNSLTCGSLSCGRMEMVALFFTSLSLFVFLQSYLETKWNHLVINTLLSGLLFALANLTTPRSAFLYLLFIIPFLKIFAVGKQTKSKKLLFIPILHICLSFGISYYCWYYPHFGNPVAFYDYLAPSIKTQISITNNHIDINSFCWLLINITLLIFAILKKEQLPAYLAGFIFCAAIFIVVVIPWSYHHAMIIPVLILAAVTNASFIRTMSAKHLVNNLLLLIICIQFFFTGLKYLVVWLDLPSRDSDTMATVIHQYIPEKSRVIGSYNYYYACMKNNCEFRSLEDNTAIDTGKPIPVPKKINYLMEAYKGEYIVAYNGEKNELMPLLQTNKFIKLTDIRIPSGDDTWWEKTRRILGLPGYTFYNGAIYKRQI